MSPLSAAYPVEVPRGVLILTASALVLLAAVGFVLLFASLASPTTPVWIVLFSIVWLAAVALLAKEVLAFPTRLELGAEGILRFVCPTRIVSVPLSSIRAIRPGRFGLLLIVHDRGTIRIPVRPTGFQDLTTRVRAASTRAVIAGP